MARLVLCLVVVCLPSVAPADTGGGDFGRQLVDDFITDIATFSSRFEQSLVDAEGEVLEVTSGTLEIQRPDRFRWSYVEPYEQVLIADGLNVWSYDVDLAQVTVKPQAEALSHTPALLLGGSAEAMQQFAHAGSYSKDEMTWVRMDPKNTDSGFLGVELGFREKQLRRMVFFDNLEQTTTVELRDVSVNHPINANRFVFVVPDDVDVVGTPAVADVSLP